jgi:hypothetical protein
MGELERINVDLSDLTSFGIKIHDTYLEIPPGLEKEIVARIGIALVFLGKRWQWFFLDVYNDLEKKGGEEECSQFLDGLGYSNGYLHNILSYGRKIARDARVLDIGWTQYEAIAQLPPAEQREWVEKIRPDPDEGRPEMYRREAREEISTYLNKREAKSSRKQIGGQPAHEEPHAVYEDCKRCRNCPDCHGVHKVRVM